MIFAFFLYALAFIFFVGALYFAVCIFRPNLRVMQWGRKRLGRSFEPTHPVSGFGHLALALISISISMMAATFAKESNQAFDSNDGWTLFMVWMIGIGSVMYFAAAIYDARRR
jgi:hypothetical protein